MTDLEARLRRLAELESAYAVPLLIAADALADMEAEIDDFQRLMADIEPPL